MFIITGGAGFIGSNLAATLQEKYPSTPLVICDTLGHDDKWRNLARRVVYDFIPPADLQTYIHHHRHSVKAIFHMGAISSTTTTDVDALLHHNVRTTLDLWSTCAQYQIPFIYASSAATYGDGAQGFDDREDLTYLSQLRPLNPYGWSKQLVDLAILQRVNQGEPTPPQWAGLKFFNVYGPNEHHKIGQHSVVLGIYPKIQLNNTAPLFTSYHPDYPHGGQVRDFIWVHDCADVMVWLMEHPQVKGLFNVGTGEARSFDDLAKAVFQALHRPPHITYVDMPEALRPKYQYFTQAAMGKLRQAGYTQPFTSLEEGVRLYVQNYLTHQDNPYR